MKEVYLLTVTFDGQNETLVFADVESMSRTIKFFHKIMTPNGRRAVQFHMARHTVYTQDAVIDELLKKVLAKMPGRVK